MIDEQFQNIYVYSPFCPADGTVGQYVSSLIPSHLVFFNTFWSPTSSIFQHQLNVYHRLYWYRLSVLISHFWENSVSIGPARRNMNRLSSRGRVGAVNHKSFASAHSAPWLHNGLYQVKNCSSCQHRWKQMVFFFFSFISRELIFYSNPCLNRFRTRLFWPWSRGWVLAYCCLRLTLYSPPPFCVTYIFFSSFRKWWYNYFLSATFATCHFSR